MSRLISIIKSFLVSIPCFSGWANVNTQSLTASYLSSKSYSKIPRIFWTLLFFSLIVMNVLLVGLFLNLETSGILYYKAYDCKRNTDRSDDVILINQGSDYYYNLNVTLSNDKTVLLQSVIWKEFCKSSSEASAKSCLREHVGDGDMDDDFTCFAIESNVDRVFAEKKQTVDGKMEIQIRTELWSAFTSELAWIIPLGIAFVAFCVVCYVVYGFKYLDGRSRFSIDRFFKQVFPDPFRLNGEISTYRLEESPNLQVVLQDATERHKEVFLHLDKRSMAEHRSAEQQEESSTQMQEMALDLPNAYDHSGKEHPVFILLRSTAIQEHETLLYYERTSTDHMKKAKQTTLRNLKIWWFLTIAMCVFLLVVSLIFLFALQRILLAVFFWEIGIIAGVYLIHATLTTTIPIYNGLHYMITSSRVVIIELWTFGLGYRIYWIPHDKISSVWYGSIETDFPTNRVTLEDQKEGKLLADIMTAKEQSVEGVLLEYSTDVKTVIDLIEEQKQTHRAQFSIE
ncbi:hypothetical protein C9374_003588 [Naegleria lovaniensis]|uniref:Uncharacterized protein n=1 Tax=Naegleria lovaniensis TaxID=51637 RepID=A0AA88H062_NAELO|nr:uncharacterized protein C9374_003588 [Naegleria lovaniensis]KAG2393824.1 hypothetical protein C9374_003588 [Naegleria lovaniensis]